MNGPSADPWCCLYTFILRGARGSGPSVQVQTMNRIIQESLIWYDMCWYLFLKTLYDSVSVSLPEMPFLTRQIFSPDICFFCLGKSRMCCLQWTVGTYCWLRWSVRVVTTPPSVTSTSTISYHALPRSVRTLDDYLKRWVFFFLFSSWSGWMWFSEHTVPSVWPLHVSCSLV